MSKLVSLQVEYDSMVEQAMRCLGEGVALTPAFQAELTRLMRVVKALGGKV